MVGRLVVFAREGKIGDLTTSRHFCLHQGHRNIFFPRTKMRLQYKHALKYKNARPGNVHILAENLFIFKNRLGQYIVPVFVKNTA